MKLELPFSRKELSEALGVGDCTMAAVTDIGFAEAFVKLWGICKAVRNKDGDDRI